MSQHAITIQGNTIKKTYKDRISRDMDLTMLEVLSGHGLAPVIHSVTEDTVILAYCSGYTVLEMLMQYEQGKEDLCSILEMFQKLEQWLTKFHEVTVKRFGKSIRLTDFHYRNFIYEKGENPRIIGVDFERYEYGDPIYQEVASYAWLSLYDFKNTEAINQLKEVLSQKSIGMQDFIKERLRKRTYLLLVKRCSCVIMSGGLSERMGSDKAELLFGTYTFMQHLLYQTGNFKEQIISTNDEKKYQKYRVALVKDNRERVGPIGGLASVLSYTTSPYVFVVCCDSPYLPEEVIMRLFSNLSEEVDGVVACVNKRANPLFAIYKREIKSQIAEQIKKKEYRLMNLLNVLSIHYVEVGDLMFDACYNVNTFHKYQELVTKVADFENFFPITTGMV